MIFNLFRLAIPRIYPFTQYQAPTAWYFPSFTVSILLLLYWTFFIASILAFSSPAGEL